MNIFSFLLALLRFLIFMLIVVYYLCKLFAFSLWEGYSLAIALRLRRQCVQDILHMLGVQIEQSGELPEGPGLLVSNHRSYLDPAIILHDLLALPVGKSEVRNWPLIGFLVQLTGAHFVDRSSKKSRRQTLLDMADTIKKGYAIINFAEGTTHTEPVTIDFKPAGFAMAAEQQIAVVPIAIDYQYMKDAWIGNDTFIPHFFQTFGKWRTSVKISYGKALRSEHAEILLTSCKNWIDGQLLVFRKDWEEEAIK